MEYCKGSNSLNSKTLISKREIPNFQKKLLPLCLLVKKKIMLSAFVLFLVSEIYYPKEPTQQWFVLQILYVSYMYSTKCFHKHNAELSKYRFEHQF